MTRNAWDKAFDDLTARGLVPCRHPEYRLSTGPARDHKTGRMLRKDEAMCLTCGAIVRRKRAR